MQQRPASLLALLASGCALAAVARPVPSSTVTVVFVSPLPLMCCLLRGQGAMICVVACLTNPTQAVTACSVLSAVCFAVQYNHTFSTCGSNWKVCSVGRLFSGFLEQPTLIGPSLNRYLVYTIVGSALCSSHSMAAVMCNMPAVKLSLTCTLPTLLTTGPEDQPWFC
jgi:hypothetical protein